MTAIVFLGDRMETHKGVQWARKDSVASHPLGKTDMASEVKDIV